MHALKLNALLLGVLFALAACGAEAPAEDSPPAAGPGVGADDDVPGPDGARPKPPASEFEVTSDVHHTGYAVRHYEFRHPESHTKAGKLAVTQHVDVVIPDGATASAAVYFLFENEQDATVEKLLAQTAVPRWFGLNMVYVVAEHRGYGQSISDADDQTVPTYVRREDAVEDAHEVIAALKAEWKGPWVVAGYSYGGAQVLELGAKYPDDADVFVASSPVVRWNALDEVHEGYARRVLGDEAFGRAAKHMAALQATVPFRSTWKNREMLEGLWVGLSQMASAQVYRDAVVSLLDLPTVELLEKLTAIDEAAGGLAYDYGALRAVREVPRADALSGKFAWRTWYYQQCSDLGVFFASPTGEGLFLRSLEDHVAECGEMFGEENVRGLAPGDITWSLDGALEKFDAEGGARLVYVNGGRDPWSEYGLAVPNWEARTSNAKLRTFDTRYGALLHVLDGFHGPDRDDVEVAVTLLGEVQRVGGFTFEPLKAK